MTERTVLQPTAEHPITVNADRQARHRPGERRSRRRDRRRAHPAGVDVSRGAVRADRPTSSARRCTRSDTTTYCPYKGDANYYHVTAGGDTVDDVIWTYEQPYPAVARHRRSRRVLRRQGGRRRRSRSALGLAFGGVRPVLASAWCSTGPPARRMTLSPLRRGPGDPCYQLRRRRHLEDQLDGQRSRSPPGSPSRRATPSTARRGATAPSEFVERLPALLGAARRRDGLRARRADDRRGPPERPAPAARAHRPGDRGHSSPPSSSSASRARTRSGRGGCWSTSSARRRPARRRRACGCRRPPTCGAASRRGSSTSPTSTRAGPAPSSGVRCARLPRAADDPRPSARRVRRCGRCQGSVSGRPPRSRSAPGAMRMPSRSGTTTCQTWSEARCSGIESTTRRWSNCWSRCAPTGSARSGYSRSAGWRAIPASGRGRPSRTCAPCSCTALKWPCRKGPGSVKPGKPDPFPRELRSASR